MRKLLGRILGLFDKLILGGTAMCMDCGLNMPAKELTEHRDHCPNRGPLRS